jgi:D-sedoheptulose 7-phosphate isomerase
MKNTIKEEIDEHIKISNSIHDLSGDILASANMCIDCLSRNGKILLCGNGGSAADAQHIAAELVGRYKTKRKGLSAIALTTDSSALTSIGNDFGYVHLFDRQIEALANKGDVVIGISTSGKSENVLSALKVASKLDCTVIGLSGSQDDEMSKVCNINLSVPSINTPRIQEMHILIGHTICHLIDQAFKA